MRDWGVQEGRLLPNVMGNSQGKEKEPGETTRGNSQGEETAVAEPGSLFGLGGCLAFRRFFPCYFVGRLLPAETCYELA